VQPAPRHQQLVYDVGRGPPRRTRAHRGLSRTRRHRIVTSGEEATWFQRTPLGARPTPRGYWVSASMRRVSQARWARLRAHLAGAMILGFASGVPACQPVQRPSPLRHIGSEAATVATEVVYESPNGGLRRALRAVVDTPEEFERLWREVHAGGSSIPSLPMVDFTREMVIVASTGFQASVGSRIAVTGVRDSSNVLEVTVEVRPFPVGCDGFSAVTYPVVMVRMPASRSTVLFQDHVIQTRC